MNSIVSEKRYIAERLGLPYESLSQSYLRSETALGNQSTIDFILQTNKKQGANPTERLLNLNDEFVVTHFAVTLKPVATLTDENEVTAERYTYVPNNALTPFTGNSTNAVSIYNSDLSWTIDRQEFVPQFPMRAFFRVPDVQTDIQAGGTTGIVDGQNTALYGFYPSEPTRIDGRQTIDLSINMGSTVDMTPGAGAVYAVFEARGYLITNALN